MAPLELMTCIPFVRSEVTKLMVEKSWLGGSTHIPEESSIWSAS